MSNLKMMSQDIEVQETMHKCIVGGTITAGGAFAGGLVGGPKGMAVGGAGGSILAALIMKVFRPLCSIIDTKWILDKVTKAINLSQSSLRLVIEMLLNIIPAFRDCKTNEDRMALIKREIIIPFSSWAIAKAILIIVREVVKAIRYV